LSCSYSVSPARASGVSGGGGSALVQVTTSPGCGWTAVSNYSWVSFDGGSQRVAGGVGSGAVTVYVGANTPNTPRSGQVTIAGITFTVSQNSCIRGCL